MAVFYIVSTPIGNLKDITLRALDTLKAVDLIACEDTRHTKKLLSRYQISTPLTSYFEHNKIKKADRIISLLKNGKDIALVSDSGTPGISDPGYYVINLAIRNNIRVIAVPGPSALTAGLILSGMPTDEFHFKGFLSPKRARRRRQLEALKELNCTIVLYESPHRIKKTLIDILEVMGDREIAIAREMTKIFEETLYLKISEAIEHFNRTAPRGEFTLVLKGRSL